MAWILGLYDRNALAALEKDYEVIQGLTNIQTHIAEWAEDSDEDLVEALVYIDIDAENVFSCLGFTSWDPPEDLELP